MNDDAYAVWLVKRKDPIYAVPVKILMAVLCLVSLLIAMQTALRKFGSPVNACSRLKYTL